MDFDEELELVFTRTEMIHSFMAWIARHIGEKSVEGRGSDKNTSCILEGDSI